jgi:hypothetical protein
MHEKDPFSDKLKDKERGEEEQYFANRERALLDKLRGKNASGREAPPRENPRGRCPNCGGPLSTTPLDAAATETCSICLGAESDRKEVVAVSRRRGERWLARFLPHSLAGTR